MSYEVDELFKVGSEAAWNKETASKFLTDIKAGPNGASMYQKALEIMKRLEANLIAQRRLNDKLGPDLYAMRELLAKPGCKGEFSQFCRVIGIARSTAYGIATAYAVKMGFKVIEPEIEIEESSAKPSAMALVPSTVNQIAKGSPVSKMAKATEALDEFLAAYPEHEDFIAESILILIEAVIAEKVAA
jgi:hypothetical protein